MRGDLQRVGPVVSAVWMVPEVYAQAIVAAGGVVPPPVRGLMLVDTGASHTAISVDCAKKLGLPPIGKQQGRGAGGKHTNDKYFATMTMLIQGATGVAHNLEVAGIPELDEVLADIRPDLPMSIIGLLGRDVLGHCVLRYDGPGGFFAIGFDVEHLMTKVRRKP